MLQGKRTKILCTIGPASDTQEKIEKMILAGMNVARLNLSHGTHGDHEQLIANIRAAERATGRPVTLLGDLQGPKVRVGDLPGEGLKIVERQTYEIPVSHPTLYKDVKTGHRVLIEDGLMDGICMGGRYGYLKVRIRVGGNLLPRKGLNFPDTTLCVDALTPKDIADARFLVKHGAHWLALSFVTKPSDITRLRKIIRKTCKNKRESPGIIAKIEKHEAVKHFDAILAEADSIMVARGDLGIEIPAEQVPLIQKQIIEKCRAVGKPVIVATQMLDSMIRNPRPTRAEVSDVANAVIDHTDAVMLSGETASGKFPVESVSTMTRIIREIESSPFDDVSIEETAGFVKKAEDAVGNAANLLSRTLNAHAILVSTMSGNTARLVSRFRPELPIIAATPSEFIRRKSNLSWAVIPIAVPKVDDIDKLIVYSIAKAKHDRLMAAGDIVIIVAGQPVGSPVNFVEVKKI